MDQQINRIVVVGGGTAGWLAASLIAAKAKRDAARNLTVTLIEAPGIPSIGVGEGTWPTMRATLAVIGIDEDELLTACDASFKQGSRFDGWVTGKPDDRYYHPFTLPVDGDPMDLLAGWRAIAPSQPFAEAVSAQPAVCASQLAPRRDDMAPYVGALNYAYHLDAAKLGLLLARHAVSALAVEHVRDQVVAIDQDDQGHLTGLQTRAGRRISGDLFIDCSGFSGLLIGRHLGVDWIDRGSILANDRALAVQVPVDPRSPIESQTVGTAHAAGWLWDIGLPTRRGIGCVYSSAFMTEEDAERVLRNYVSGAVGGAAAAAMTPRALSFNSGHRSEFWRGNCVAVGQSAGFIEPLEASAIVMIELAMRALCDNFPASRASMPIHARRFNALFRERWDRIVEFLKLHYVLSERWEPYWRAQRAAGSVPHRLNDLLTLWQDQPPSAYDLPLADEIFPAASYQYVYYGMRGALPARLPEPTAAMRRQLGQVQQRARGLKDALPTNRIILNNVAARVTSTKAAGQ